MLTTSDKVMLLTTRILLFVLFVVALVGAKGERGGHLSVPNYTSYSYPIPSVKGAQYECRTDPASYLCDPDSVLDHEEQEVLIQRLQRFERETGRVNASNPCKAKGVKIGVALSEREVDPVVALIPLKSVAAHLFERWALDRECGKTGMIVFDNQKKKISFSTGSEAIPIFLDEFSYILRVEHPMFMKGDTLKALLLILDDLQLVATNRMALLEGKVKEKEPVGQIQLSPRNLALMAGVAVVASLLVFGLGGCAYHFWAKHQPQQPGGQTISPGAVKFVNGQLDASHIQHSATITTTTTTTNNNNNQLPEKRVPVKATIPQPSLPQIQPV